MKSSSKVERPVVLVSGGAGYIGRTVAELLWDNGFQPIVLDCYSTSRPFQSETLLQHKLDLSDRSALQSLWGKLPPIWGILHFAAFALVSESYAKPAEYFRNNVLSTLNLAEAAASLDIPFVHSSSCAVYGVPSLSPIPEQVPLAPISPYGESKRVSEQILAQFCSSRGLRALNLRYFNPAGSVNPQLHGECHEPETHLIPNVLRAGLNGKPVSVYGNSYPTPDGTCIRDYVHIEDLARGHLSALDWLTKQPKGFCDFINLGSGKGYSVLEVIREAEKVLDRRIEVEICPARPADPPNLVASVEKATRLLKWSPRFGLETILRSHLEWEHRRVYGSDSSN